MPLVSVILPVFNAADSVARAINSILNQTLSDIELIVVDDGSTDATVHVIRQVRDSRLKLVTTDHAGVATAANLGTGQAQAELIARMDADDLAHPQKLQEQVRLLTETGLDVVGCQVRIVNPDGSPAATMRRYERWINEETLTTSQIHALRFVELPLVNPTILARRRYFESGFSVDDLPEDYDLMLRGAADCLRFGKVSQVLFDWTDSNSRLTRTDAHYSTDAFMRCRRKHLLAGPLAHADTVDLWGLGRTGKPWFHWLTSKGISIRRIFEVHPRKIGRDYHGVPVIDADNMPPKDGLPLVIAVGAAGARTLIQDHIAERGYADGEDAWFVA